MSWAWPRILAASAVAAVAAGRAEIAATPEVTIQVSADDIARPRAGTDPETVYAADGAYSVKEYYPTGMLRQVTRHDRKGRLIGIFYRDPAGTATHADIFNGERLTGRLHYHPNGYPLMEEHIDAGGVTRWFQQWDSRGRPVLHQTFDARGRPLERKVSAGR